MYITLNYINQKKKIKKSVNISWKERPVEKAQPTSSPHVHHPPPSRRNQPESRLYFLRLPSMTTILCHPTPLLPCPAMTASSLLLRRRPPPPSFSGAAR
ncbi:hypothetical protein SORBI_3002G158600 [Sorghum bicolor]|uniref:Uncharacterized protein n=1 Tax=Sorghum bicolor TaxID=4558 RepID=A0A1B6QBM4_SORBI|nr:hypothetical protein SORBI_3002G158600 [Sorghum bicolor]